MRQASPRCQVCTGRGSLMKSAPAFMFYASDAIADKRYRLMTLPERGLYLSMLCECWVNRAVPKSPDDLAKWLGYPPGEIRAGLTERVLSFFIEESGELKSPDLERYRKELDERRAKQVSGGKKGAKTKWGKASRGDGLPNGSPNEVTMAPRVEKSGEEKIKDESSVKADISDPWIEDYERASRGE